MKKQVPIWSVRFLQVRNENRYTQSEFAFIVGCGKTTADIERGKVRITGETVMELYKQFNINPMWLFGQSDKKQIAR